MRFVDRLWLIVAIIAAGLTLRADTGFAQEDYAPTPEQVTERSEGFLALWNALREGESGLRVRLEPALVSSAKYDGARLWWYRTGLSVEAGFLVTDKFNLGISPRFAFEELVAKGSDDFNIAQEGRDSNVSDFFDGSLTIGGKYDLDDRWGMEIVVRTSARQEAGAAFSDSVQVGGSLAGTYRRGRWLRLRLGLGIGSDLSSDVPRFTPVYRIMIRPVPRLSLETSGLNGTAEYDLSNLTALSISGGLTGTQYNLERRSRPPAGLGVGTLQRRQSYLTLGVKHRLREWVRIYAEFGLVFKEELTLLDSDGVTVDERNERTASGNGRIRLEFRL